MDLSTMPRTWFASGSAGTAVFVRRFEDPDSISFYEVYGYAGDLASDPRLLALPEDMPETFPTLDAACQYGAKLANTSAAAFVDATLGRRVRIDILDALWTLAMSPLYAGIHAEEIMRLLGMPESAQQLWERNVCWLYGSVQVHFDEGRLIRLEIDGGVADFTSLHFDNWFLDPTSNLDDVAAYLERNEVLFRRVTRYDAPALEVGPERDPQFVIDFHTEASVVHALYWGTLEADRRN